MGTIDINSFMSFCKKFEGQRFNTIGGRAEFILVSAQDNYLVYTPVSQLGTRHHTRRRIERVLYRYAQTKSLRPKDYHGITFNASYVLRLIKLYQDLQPK